MTGPRARHSFTAFTASTCLATALCLGAAGCRSAQGPAPSPSLTDRAAARLGKRGSDAFAGGRYAAAREAYLEALQQARAADKPVSIANAAYNAAACSIALGELDRAEPYLVEARAAFTTLGDHDGTAAAWLLSARIPQARGRHGDTLRLADLALASYSAGSKNAPGAAHAHALKAFVYCEVRDFVQAQASLDAARAIRGEARRDESLRADLLVTEGRILLSGDSKARAAARFDDAVEAYRLDGRHQEMAISLVRAAHAYEALSQHRKAGDRFYRAARSLEAQGLTAAVPGQLEAALKAAEAAQDTELAERCRALLATLRDRTADLRNQDSTTGNTKTP